MPYTKTPREAASLFCLAALLLTAAGCITIGSGTATALPAAGQDDGGGNASGGGGGAGGNDGAGSDTGGAGEDPGGSEGDPDAGPDGTGDDGTAGDPDAGTDGAGGGDVGTDGGADTDGVGDVGTDGPGDGGTDGAGDLDDVSPPRVNIFVSDFTPAASSLVTLSCSVEDSGGGFVTSFSFSSTAGASTITHDGVNDIATAFVTPGLATISFTCRATNEAGQGPSSDPRTVTVTGG